MKDEIQVATQRRALLVAITVGALLLIVFATLSATAVSTKSATADEPLHAAAAYVRTFHGDFRVDCEDPPLFGYWAMIPHNSRTLDLAPAGPVFEQLLHDARQQWTWTSIVMYATPGNEPDVFLRRSRIAMLAWGIALGAVIAAWAWRLAGPVAAVAALALYAFDPNFLGHAPLVKNDVPITLAIFAAMFAAWSVGQAVRWWNLTLLALLVGVTVNVKFSGLIILPILALTLLGRAFVSAPWPIFGRSIPQIGGKLCVVAGIGVVCAMGTILLTWASYGFRFSPAPDQAARLNIERIRDISVGQRTMAETARRGGIAPSDEEIEGFADAPIIRFVLFAEKHQLLPQAWLAGLLTTYASTYSRNSFLLGEIRTTGWWYYFPLAILFKTPSATLIAALLSPLLVLRPSALRLRPEGERVGVRASGERWTRLCIAIPIVLYVISAMRTDLNLGVRHVFPIYPFLFLTIGVTLARVWPLFPTISTFVSIVLAIGLIAESLAAYPNYIAFFNTSAGGWRRGIHLLGDSNLDWGQDLLLLKKWQDEHPDTPLYTAYFGMTSPDYYLRFTALPGTTNRFGQSAMPASRGVMAISATHLQGIYLLPEQREMYRRIHQTLKPVDILGGTIYLYEVPAQLP